VDGAIALYHQLKTAEPNGYDFSEPELNGVGYALLVPSARISPPATRSLRMPVSSCRTTPFFFALIDATSRCWRRCSQAMVMNSTNATAISATPLSAGSMS
jgi:hypothetical protein